MEFHWTVQWLSFFFVHSKVVVQTRHVLSHQNTWPLSFVYAYFVMFERSDCTVIATDRFDCIGLFCAFAFYFSFHRPVCSAFAHNARTQRALQYSHVLHTRIQTLFR